MMKAKFNHGIRNFLYGIIVAGMFISLCFSMRSAPAVRAQASETDTPAETVNDSQTQAFTRRHTPTSTPTAVPTTAAAFEASLAPGAMATPTSVFPPMIFEGNSTSVTMSRNGSPAPFALTLYATNPYNDPLDRSIKSPASNGTASASGTGDSQDIHYTPNSDYTGTDSFVVQAEDEYGGTDAILVNVFIIEEDLKNLFAAPAASGTGNCSDWSDACTLQTALTRAIRGDEIWAAAGTYKPTTGTDRSATFQLQSGVALYGGFAGTETARSQRNPTVNITILSGDLNGDDVGFTNNAENVYHVVTCAD
jgi:hypothetical protein